MKTSSGQSYDQFSRSLLFPPSLCGLSTFKQEFVTWITHQLEIYPCPLLSLFQRSERVPFPYLSLCHCDYRATRATELGRYRLLEAMYTGSRELNASLLSFYNASGVTLDELMLSTAHSKYDLIVEWVDYPVPTLHPPPNSTPPAHFHAYSRVFAVLF